MVSELGLIKGEQWGDSSDGTVWFTLGVRVWLLWGTAKTHTQTETHTHTHCPKLRRRMGCHFIDLQLRGPEIRFSSESQGQDVRVEWIRLKNIMNGWFLMFYYFFFQSLYLKTHSLVNIFTIYWHYCLVAWLSVALSLLRLFVLNAVKSIALLKQRCENRMLAELLCVVINCPAISLKKMWLEKKCTQPVILFIKSHRYCVLICRL